MSVLTGLLAALLAGGSVFKVGVVMADAATDARTVGWPAYGGADGGGHFSPATEITPANVAQLEVAWTHRSGDYRQGVIRGV
ncbi:MAG: hypothetical protein ACKOBM_02865 [Gammaproteobacteria bacterium]